MADLHPQQRTTLHPGVDPQSWLGFEQRIQARRFDALVAGARAALENGNAVLAEHSIEEAREIRPDAVELVALQAQLRELTRAAHGPFLWRRAFGALMLLIVGVSMFVALDILRIPPGTLQTIAPPPPIPAGPTFRRGFSMELPIAEPVAPRLPDVFDAELRSASASDVTSEEEEGEEATAIAGPATPARPSGLPREAPPAERTPLRRDVAPLGPREMTTPSERSAINGDVERVVARPPALDDNGPAAPAPTTPTPLNAARTAGITPTPSAVAAANITSVAARERIEEEDQSRVADVLRRYARAYGDLDVSAAREVWPRVDQRALARAFDGLASQSVSFDACQIDVHGTTANASCRGRTSYVGKVGRGEPRTEPRTWRFELRRDGETWVIENAEARRTSS